MPTLFAVAMDGMTYEADVDHNEMVASVKAKLATSSGIHRSEIVLILDATILQDSEQITDIMNSDVPEIVLTRKRNEARRLVEWYDRWIDVSKATVEVSDRLSWRRLGACLYSLGEYAAAWSAYKKAAHVAINFKTSISDKDLLDDPYVGKYVRLLPRAWDPRFRFDNSRAVDLFKMLVGDGRGNEIVSKQWNVDLPCSFSAVISWLVTTVNKKVSVKGVQWTPQLKPNERLPVYVSPCGTESWCLWKNCVQSNLDVDPCIPNQVHNSKLAIAFDVVAGELSATVTLYSELIGKVQTERYVVDNRYRASKSKRRANKLPGLGDSLFDWDDDWDSDWDDYEVAVDK